MSAGKPSGLKPPSKIGKPSALPTKTSPTSSGTKTVTSPTASSNQDAASEFAVGERVWVNGNKPGYVKFVGGTQFAPGQWAGIVLDEPIGKNDGSVAGVRYFQCEDQRGIFTRPSKLSHTPLAETDVNGSHTPASKTSGRRTSLAKDSLPDTANPATTATTKTSTNLTRAASGSASNLSETDSTKKLLRELKLGDRVLVGGSKAGVVRFLGETDFAKGEWCGVELDEPLGKNDGAVASVRYFQCLPKYGLFAPTHKVTRIGFPSTTPAKAKSTRRRSTLKHSPSASSISSISSVTSSVGGKPSRAGLLTETSARYARKISGTTALQEALKEKQQHIEQLLAERDLERTEVARATSHAGEVQQELVLLRQGKEQYAVEMEAKLDQLRRLVETADRDKVELMNQLEEEKRKVEDLQFSVEEACITKGDLEVATVSERSRIMELEKEVAELQLQMRTLRAETAGSASPPLQDKKIKELKAELESQQKEMLLFQQRLISSEQEKTSGQQQLQQMKQKLDVAAEENIKATQVMQEMERNMKMDKEKLEQVCREKQDLQKDLAAGHQQERETERQVKELKEKTGSTERELSREVEKSSLLERQVEELTKYKEQIQRSQSDQKLQDVTEKNQELQKELEALKHQNSHYQEQLSSETQRIGNLCKEIEELKRSQRSASVEESEAISRLEITERDNANSLMSDKDKELETLRNEISVLRGESAMARSLQSAVESLEGDKAELQSRVNSLEKKLEGQQSGNGLQLTSGDAALDQLREEKEFAEGQINFLNSVIVDLQRKNEELKVKLKKMALTEFNGNDEDDGLAEVTKKKKAAPRVFCDICDCFDMHDTEDCPTQTQSADSPPHTAYHGRRSDQRPYCDICEAFGHSTDSCNDDQTF